ncbi:MAG: polymer-forming cytoskeletal protein [Candidatus Omnitrophica bacterium]|nr:polymer-forming cytoskeletal protein [Candidatus Omnitrophota bacterium]
MALGRRKQTEPIAERWLEVDASMTGTLAFKDPVNLQINGQFDGALDTKGNLSIGQKAQVKATIQGEAITISGTVTGSVTATTRVELLSSARVTGKVSSPRVIMHDGAVLQGTLGRRRGGCRPSRRAASGGSIERRSKSGSRMRRSSDGEAVDDQ